MGKPQLKKTNILLRLVLGLLTLALVLAGAALVVFRDRLNLDALKRWYTYRSLSLSDSGQAESFHYSSSESDVFADLNGDLLVCGKNSISLYSGSGVQYIDQPVNFSSPAVAVGGGSAVVYDAGGTDLYVFRRREQVFSLHSDGMLLSASLNDNGLLTVVSQQSSYRGVATVYDSSFDPSAYTALRLSSTCLMDARLAADNRTLATVCVGQQDGEFTSTLALYDLGNLDTDGVSQEAVPTASCSLGGNVVLELGTSDGRWWALGDQGLWLLDGGGTILGILDWSDRILKAYTLSGDGFSAALLGKYRADSQSSLSVVDRDGVLTGTLTLGSQVLSLDAAGRYFAVLTADRLDIYTRDMQLYSSLSGTQGAQRVLLREDGTAILISSGTARLYVPG